MSAKVDHPPAVPKRQLSNEEIQEESINRSLQALNSQERSFVDENGIRWDTTNSEFEGFLYKKSKWIGEWRKRYFILKGSKLFFAKTGTSHPHGMIDLIDCVTVKSAEHKAQKRNAFEVTLKNDHFLMYAMTDKEKDEWIGRIGKAIVKHSSMYLHDDHDKKEEEEEEDDEDDEVAYPHPHA